MAEVDEWTLRLVDEASGSISRIVSGLDQLAAAQQRVVASSAGMSRAVRTSAAGAAGKGAPGGGAAGAPPPGAAGAPAGAPAMPEGAGRFLGKRRAIAEAFGGQMASQLQALREIGGPLGAAAGAAANLGGQLERLGPAGVAASIGVKVLTYAATGAVAALMAMAAAAISVAAERAKLLATFSALSFGGAGGARTLAIVERLGVALPFATSEIAKWATGLQKAGLQGRALESAIKAVAAAEALIPGGAEAAEKLITTLAMGGPAAMQLIAALKRGGPEARSQLADMGLRVQDLAAALGMTVAQFQRANLSARQMAEAVERALARKAAGPLADLMLTFPSMLSKLKEGFLSLFDKLGPSVKPFMKAVKELFGDFSKGGAAINFLKPIVTSVMSTLFGWATRAVTAVRGIIRAFMDSTKAGGMFGGVIAVVKTVASVFLSMGKLVAVPLATVGKLLLMIFSNALVLQGIKTILTVVAAAFGALAVVIGGIITFFGLAISLAASVVGALAGFLAAAPAAAVGFIDGLIDGLRSGAGGVIGAITDLANGAVAAFKGALGIASPSRVMMQMGGHTVDGFSQGVDASADRAQASMDAMVTPKGGKGGAAGKGGFTFTNCTFGEGMSEATVRDLFAKVLGELAAEGAPA